MRDTDFYKCNKNLRNIFLKNNGGYQDKADLVYSLNAGDVQWCVNAKGIKGVSCTLVCLPQTFSGGMMVYGGV